ncbi:hypothetical protein BX600DRAFT_510330 [Xylariales sp. PMI_506]|nr:hypothetical protein BX600DRAFT_510330 [Xylariales sp. PMI_506]
MATEHRPLLGTGAGKNLEGGAPALAGPPWPGAAAASYQQPGTPDVRHLSPSMRTTSAPTARAIRLGPALCVGSQKPDGLVILFAYLGGIAPDPHALWKLLPNRLRRESRWEALSPVGGSNARPNEWPEPASPRSNATVQLSLHAVSPGITAAIAGFSMLGNTSPPDKETAAEWHESLQGSPSLAHLLISARAATARRMRSPHRSMEPISVYLALPGTGRPSSKRPPALATASDLASMRL